MIKVTEGSYIDYFTKEPSGFDEWFGSLEVEVNKLKASRLRTSCNVIPNVPYAVKFDSQIAGPELIITLGIHGNETAAFFPVSSLMQDLLSGKEALNCGRLVVAVGNIHALKQGKRSVIGEDNLNRIFKKEIKAGSSYTQKRVEELKRLIDGSYEREVSFNKRYHIDFHTTTELSDDFFICSKDDLEFAKDFGSNYIIAMSNDDINKYIGGTTLDYGKQNNLISLTFEAGTHYSNESVERSKKALHEMLHRSGIMGSVTKEEKRHDPNVIQIQEIFKKNCNTFKFSKYKNGASFKNFDFIPKGFVIGVDDTNGEYKAERNFTILLPTPPEIQSEGEEICYLGIPTDGPIYQEWIREGYFY